jgi:DNA repair protein RadC
MARASISVQLKYKVPQMRLCLVSDRKMSRLQHITSPTDAGRLLTPLRYASEEQFVALHLNCRHEVIGLHEVSKGTLASSLVHPREVFKAALLANSYAILVCHNHPSGSQLEPSKDDLQTTEVLIKAGDFIGVSVLDHIIIGPNGAVYSIKENFPDLWSK